MRDERLAGLAYGLAAYLLWGLFPWYFHFLKGVPPLEVLTHRVVWSFLLLALVAFVLGRWHAVRAALAVPRLARGLLLSALLIAANWLLFLWAVAQDRVVESSLGYFLTPLVSVLLARLFLHEQLDGFRRVACLIAALGVGWLVWQVGSLPWLSLTLAVTFGLYGLVRKQLPVDSLAGLTVETGLLFPLAVSHLVWLEWQGGSHFTLGEPATALLLVCSGALTAAPLLLFASGAKRLSLTTIGFLMYVNPTLQFLTAVHVFGEPFTAHQRVAFALIWVALAVFSWGAVAQRRPRGAQ